MHEGVGATVDHTVDHNVPVDPDSPPRISLVLLELPAEEVPVGGTQPLLLGTTIPESDPHVSRTARTV